MGHRLNQRVGLNRMVGLSHGLNRMVGLSQGLNRMDGLNRGLNRMGGLSHGLNRGLNQRATQRQNRNRGAGGCVRSPGAFGGGVWQMQETQITGTTSFQASGPRSIGK
jgi:hypothetical protein